MRRVWSYGLPAALIAGAVYTAGVPEPPDPPPRMERLEEQLHVAVPALLPLPRPLRTDGGRVHLSTRGFRPVPDLAWVDVTTESEGLHFTRMNTGGDAVEVTQPGTHATHEAISSNWVPEHHCLLSWVPEMNSQGEQLWSEGHRE